MKHLLIILTMILVLISIDNAEKEAKLKEIQIIKEAEDSNDPVLKQKAADLKAEIVREEQVKLQRQIETQQSEERFQKLAKNMGVERDTLEVVIVMVSTAVLTLVAYLIFKLKFKSY